MRIPTWSGEVQISGALSSWGTVPATVVVQKKRVDGEADGTMAVHRFAVWVYYKLREVDRKTSTYSPMNGRTFKTTYRVPHPASSSVRLGPTKLSNHCTCISATASTSREASRCVTHLQTSARQALDNEFVDRNIPPRKLARLYHL